MGCHRLASLKFSIFVFLFFEGDGLMKNVIKLCAVLCVLQMSGVATAQDTNWSNGGGDAEWTNNLNWSSGAVVGGTNFVTDISLPAAMVTTPGVSAARVVTDTGGAVDITAAGQLDVGGQILMGNGPGSSTINVDGRLRGTNIIGVGTAGGGDATLTVGPTGLVDMSLGAWIIAGFGAGTTGTIDVNGGTITVANDQLGVGWDGDGDLNVNAGGTVNANVVMNVGVNNAAAHGDIVINSGTINAGGLNLGNNVGSGTLLIEDAGLFNNNGGFVQTPGSTVTINDGGQFVFTASPLLDVQNLVLGNSDWIFSGIPSVTGSLGNVVVQNVPEPTSLVLLFSSMAWMGLAVRRR